MQIFPVVGPNGKHKHATSKLALRERRREVGERESLVSLNRHHIHTRAEKQRVLMSTNMFMCSPDVPGENQKNRKDSVFGLFSVPVGM